MPPSTGLGPVANLGLKGKGTVVTRPCTKDALPGQGQWAVPEITSNSQFLA